MHALVIAGHGSHLNPDSSRPVYDHADTIRRTEAFDEVREAFWKEEPSFREVLRTLESDTVYVVPLFVSEGYFTQQVIPRELRLTDGWELDVDKTVHYTAPVGTHDAMGDVIVERAEAIVDNPDVGPGFGLAVVGHGTERSPTSAAAIRHHADQIRDSGRFEEVRALFMDEAPRVERFADHFRSRDVIVVPLFIADGYHTTEDLPEDLGLTDDYRDGYDVPTLVGDHRIWYSGAVGTEPLLAEVIVERAAEAGADVGDARSRVRRIVGRDSAVSTTYP